MHSTLASRALIARTMGWITVALAQLALLAKTASKTRGLASLSIRAKMEVVAILKATDSVAHAPEDSKEKLASKVV